MAKSDPTGLQAPRYVDTDVLITGMHKPGEFVAGHFISFGMALGCGSGALFMVFTGAAPAIPFGAFFGIFFGLAAGLFDGILLRTIVGVILRLTHRNFFIAAHAIRWLTPFVTLLFAYLLFSVWSRYSAGTYLWISDYTRMGSATAIVAASLGGYIIANKFERAFLDCDAEEP